MEDQTKYQETRLNEPIDKRVFEDIDPEPGKLESLKIMIFGNRITLASVTGVLAGGALIAESIQQAPDSNMALVRFVIGGLVFCVSAPLVTITQLGHGTLITYRQTCKRLRRGTKITPEFVESCYKMEPNRGESAFSGYCEERGIAIAAEAVANHEHGSTEPLENLNEIRENHSSVVIPVTNQEVKTAIWNALKKLRFWQ